MLCALAVAILTICTFSGCSSGDNTANKEQEEVPGAVTGRVAFQNMYTAARLWHADAQPVVLESNPHEGKDLRGKAGIWRATFVSPASRKQRDFMYVGVDLADGLNRGLRQGQDSDYSPGGGEQPFSVAYLKTDSDQAFSVAEKNGGRQMRQKEKDFQIFYTLHRENEGRPALAWDVIYGHSRTTAPFVAHVDASSGQVLYVRKPPDIH